MNNELFTAEEEQAARSSLLLTYWAVIVFNSVVMIGTFNIITGGSFFFGLIGIAVVWLLGAMATLIQHERSFILKYHRRPGNGGQELIDYVTDLKEKKDKK